MSRRNSIEIDSRELDRQLKKAIRRNPELAAKKVTAIACDLASLSTRLTPVETGDLKNNCVANVNGTIVFENSAKTGRQIMPSLKVSAEVGYSLPYALRQHEELGYSHNKTDGKRVDRKVRFRTQDGQVHEYIGTSTVNCVAGGQAKFLEQPFAENEQKYIDMLKSIPDEALR